MTRAAHLAVALIPFIVLLLAPTPIRADEPKDGNFLLHSCKEVLKEGPRKTPQEATGYILGMWCMGYLAGFTDMNALYQGAVLGESNGFFCLPNGGLEAEQLTRVVVKHLEANPEKLHDSARTLTLVALATAFPCSKAKP